ncbi:MAG: N-acetyltransferase family protein [Rhizomicrobium sp.]
MSYVIRALTPALVEKFLDYFDHDAFADNPGWQFCYCNFVHYDHRGPAFSGTEPAANRAAVAARICARKMHGFLAFEDERVVGWCQAAPRTTILTLATEPDPDGTATQVGSVVCFVIAKAHRGKGLASQLLGVACETFKAQGLAFAEAYPKRDAETEAANHTGPLGMYLKFGFSPYRTDPDGTVVVRLPLK